MFFRVPTLLAVASAVAALGLAAPHAHADPQTDEQRFFEMMQKSGIGGDHDTLLKYAHQFCDNTTVENSARSELYGQGVRADQFYAINVAASQVYCPKKIATPPTK